MKRNTNQQKIMERITRRRTGVKKMKEETITINEEQLEELLRGNECAKEWKVSEYYEENNEFTKEIRELKERLEFWEKEYLKQDKKVEKYRNKYSKWKRKTKGLRYQREQEMKKNKTEKRCFNCSKLGHYLRDCKEIEKCYICGKEGHRWDRCHKRPRCEKCNRRGHMKDDCGNKEIKEEKE